MESAGKHASSAGGAEASFADGNRRAAQGALREAEKAYRQAAELGHPTAAAYAGVLAEAREDLTEAEKLYRQADDAGDGFGAFRLGLLLSRAGDWEGAEEAWKRADERGREEPPFDAGKVVESRDEAPPRGAQRAVFANPVLLGAVTVLVLLIGVFLAYNSNSGLPFVPTRELKVDIPNGTALVPGNQVEAGSGYDIGIVSSMQPVRLPGGQTVAQLLLQLSSSYGPVPADSTVTIGTRSVLGLKFVSLNRGHSSRTLPDGGTLPISQASVPVQFDDINKMFDARTRPAVQANLVGFGDALAARGSSLNDTFAELPALLGHLRPVAAYLSDPSTQLTRFLGSLERFFGTLSPVASTSAQLFGEQASTFEAISQSPRDLEDTIHQTPPTLSVSTDSLIHQQPFLVDLKRFSDYLRPATSSLRAALPALNPALEAGIRVLPRTPALNVRLDRVLAALRALARDPGTNVSLNTLTGTVGILSPMLKYLGPFVTVCNTWNYFWTDLADTVSEQTTLGSAQRALIMFGNHQTNNVGTAGATAPADGYKPGDVPDPSTADAEYYHGPAYGAAVTNGGEADCETGQRGYPLRVNHLDPQGRNFDTDAQTLGVQGMNWSGLSRVPPGETFSRHPTSGPQVPYIPANP